MNLQPLTAQDIAPGRPLPWPIYDTDGHLLFERGETLAVGYPMIGLCRSVNDDATVEATPVEEFNTTGPFEEVPARQVFPPDGIKPQMWEIIQLRLLGHERNTHYFSRMVGYIKDISILSTIPRAQHQSVPMVEGELVEVRMLTGRNIYVFRSEVVKICLQPSPYMHLSFPGNVQCQRLRKTPWAKASLPVRTECDAGHVDGLIVNLSADGARVDSHAKLGKEGLIVTLRFLIDLDGLKREMALSARIMHVRLVAPNKPGGEPAMMEHGVAFQGVAEQDALWLRSLVYQRIAEGYLV